MFPLIIKKQISELSIASALLFFGVIIFNILLIILKFDKGAEITYNKGDDQHFYQFRFDQAFLSSLSIAFIAFGFQSSFFPVYNLLEDKSYKRGITFASLAMGFSFVIYACIMFSGLYAFGTSIEGDVLINVSELERWESYVLRVIFLLIMVTHTPFVFFIGKESVLGIAVLIYQKYTRRDEPQLINQDFEDEPLLEEPDFPNKKIIVPKRNWKSMGDKRKKSIQYINDTRSMNSIELTISRAIPYSHKSTRVMNDDEKFEKNRAAHLILPNKIYYPVSLGLFIMVVGSS